MDYLWLRSNTCSQFRREVYHRWTKVEMAGFPYKLRLQFYVFPRLNELSHLTDCHLPDNIQTKLCLYWYPGHVAHHSHRVLPVTPWEVALAAASCRGQYWHTTRSWHCGQPFVPFAAFWAFLTVEEHCLSEQVFICIDFEDTQTVMSVSHIWQIRNGTGEYASQWDLEIELQKSKNSENMT